MFVLGKVDCSWRSASTDVRMYTSAQIAFELLRCPSEAIFCLRFVLKRKTSSSAIVRGSWKGLGY